MNLTGGRLRRFLRLGAWGLPVLACLPCLAVGIGAAGVGLGIVLTVVAPLLGGVLVVLMAVVFVRRWSRRHAD